MDKEIIKKLLSKPDYYKYLKENSEWVNILRKDKKMFNEFVKFIKQKYKLRVEDKISTVVDNIDMLSSVLSDLN